MPSLTRAMSWGWLLAVVLALWLVGCARDSERELELLVVDDRGEGLAEVLVRADGDPLARSGADGKLTAVRARLKPGGSLTAECPEAYRPAAPLALSEPLLPRSLQLVCRPRLRTLAVVAYAPHAVGALLRADAQALGRVAPDGTLHAVLRRPPGVTVELRLEAEAELRRSVAVRDRDEIVVIDGER